MVNKLKAILLARQLKQHRCSPQAAGATTNLATAKTITLLFPATGPADTKTLKTWAENRRKSKQQVQLVAYHPTAPADHGHPTLHPSDKSWYGGFKGPTYDTFRSEKTDLLLRLGPPTHPELDQLAGVKPAALSVGPYGGESKVYDLFYDAGKDATFADQLRAIESIFRYTNASSKS